MKGKYIPIEELGYKYKHGQSCRCYIGDEKIADAKISINSNGEIHICQHKRDGIIASNLFGYSYSWTINSGDSVDLLNNNVTKLELLIIDEYIETPFKIGDEVLINSLKDKSIINTYGSTIPPHDSKFIITDIVDIDTEFIYIVEYIDKYDELVRLGFKENDLSHKSKPNVTVTSSSDHYVNNEKKQYVFDTCDDVTTIAKPISKKHKHINLKGKEYLYF